MEVETGMERHPLTSLIARSHGTATGYLRRLADRHQALGYGTMAVRREKVSRWTTGTVPELSAQLAMADLHGVDPDEVYRRGWPDWLLLAFTEDAEILASPWTPAGTDKALNHSGGPVDRRSFLVVSSTSVAGVLASWSSATAVQATPGEGRNIGPRTVDLFDARLDALRHLDDQVGSGEVYDAAAAELRLVTRLISNAAYTQETGKRLYSTAAELSRELGWTAYDSGYHAIAERHFVTALRAAASADDPITGANILSFWAIQRYSTGDPNGAVHMVEAALAQQSRMGSPRMAAMLHARAGRAHSKTGDVRSSDREIGAAFDTYDRAAPTEDDHSIVYWVNLGELHQLAGSCALNLDKPARALTHFEAAANATRDAYDGDSFPRGFAIYLARQAEARLALDDLDGAVATANEAIEHMGGVTSARATTTLIDLRAKLAKYNTTPVARDFLEATR